MASGLPNPHADQPKAAPRIVVIGGGTGSFAVLNGLKAYTRHITAIVNMSDDGGSTGALRDELGALPPGDIRQCLVALAADDTTMRELFNYRFEAGALEGHSFGNLFLTALEKTTGSFAEAVKTTSRVLNITGRVVPVTLTNTHLVLTEGHSVIRGQRIIEEHTLTATPPSLSLEPQAELNPEAKTAIAEADLVVIAPGNLYTSLAPTLIVPGVAEALSASPARIMYAANLVTKPGQTDGFKVHDFAREIERFIGPNTLDSVIYNHHQPTPALLKKYARAGEYAVDYDPAAFKTVHYKAVGTSLVADNIPKLKPADQQIPRTLIRHNPGRLAETIINTYLSL